MKIIYILLALSVLMLANTKKVKDPDETVLERYMDFNTSYYTKKEYEKSFHEALHSKKEELSEGLGLEELALLGTNIKIKKKQYLRHKRLSLSTRYTDIQDVLRDDAFVKYMTKKDKVAKLSLVIVDNQKAIVEYLGGDSRCLWSTRYLLLLMHKTLDIYDMGGFSGEYAPMLLVVPEN